MTREEICKDIVSLPHPYILAELPTGVGKTKIALDVIHDRVINRTVTHILIVVPRLVLIENWKAEIIKWGYKKWLNMFEFVTYNSLPKRLANRDLWDLIVFDEAHHLSKRCREAIDKKVVLNSILLSATVNKNLKEELSVLFPSLFIYRVTIKQAMSEEILPSPRVYLIPLTLDNIHANCKIVRNPSQKIELLIPYADRWKYASIKNRRIIIKCTPRQYYDDISSLITWYKKKTHNEIFKNLFLRKSGERLKWLSRQKTTYVKTLLEHLNEQRTLTFCNSIPQTEELGKYCINSKNKASEENLHKFNEGKINHITACNMLDEGVNLTDCRIGVYAVLNSSERMIKQKLGRLLRHSDPIIIIPYFKDTRDEEIVGKMLEDYDPELVKTITNLTDLQL